MLKTPVFALIIALTLVTAGCTDQWIKVALADLPVLTEMALNIGTLTVTLSSGKQFSQTDQAAVAQISAEAGRDLQLIDNLYQDYKAKPGQDTLQKIQNAISTIDARLPWVLMAVHVADPDLSARVTAAVNLILATVDAFAQLMPQPVATQRRLARQGIPGTVATKTKPPTPDELKAQWNLQVAPQFKIKQRRGFFDLVGESMVSR